jgi:phosphoribosyl 1,2-cyclic phosphodiesterase
MSARVEALLLGSAQAGGVPQAGCRCATCTGARRDPARRYYGTSHARGW